MARNRQHQLYEALCDAERNSTSISLADLAARSGHSVQTLRSYRAKRYLEPFLTTAEPGRFRVHNVLSRSFEYFAERMTQRKGTVAQGRLRHKLARSLADRAKDNLTLALELFNRPSIENRIDAFVILFCTAWEQLLKAQLVEEHGDASIWLKRKEDRPSETISMRMAIESVKLPANVKSNLLLIIELRNQATHLLVREALPYASRLFQSGINNFISRYHSVTSQRMFSNTSGGLVSLVHDIEDTTVVDLTEKYGPSGVKIFELISSIKTQVVNNNDPTFAIPIELTLRFAKGSETPDLYVSNDASARMGLIPVEKPSDSARTHPFRLTDLREEVNKILRARMPEREFSERFSHPGKVASVREYDVQAVLFKEKWDSDPSVTLFNSVFNRKSYSIQSAELISQKLAGDPKYLASAQASYQSAQRKKKIQKAVASGRARGK